MLKAMVLVAIPLFIAGYSRAEEKVIVTKHDCHRLVAHSPGSDVEFRPGVDVRGKPVVPADVAGSPSLALPEAITIAIGIELDERMGLGAGGRYKGTAPIGQVSVTGNRVYFNGQLLADRDQSAIASACRDAYGRKR